MAFARAVALDLGEDAVHDVIAHEVSKGREPAERIEYLMRAVRNRIAAIRRRQHRENPAAASDGMGQTKATVDSQGILQKIDESDRAIVVLRVQCELSFPQIGVALDLPTGTVSSRYSRAIERLRGDLAEEGRSDEQRIRISVA